MSVNKSSFSKGYELGTALCDELPMFVNLLGWFIIIETIVGTVVTVKWIVHSF